MLEQRTKSFGTLVKVSDQRYRESHGLYFEDFDVGDIYEHRPGRTITQTDNTWQSMINGNMHPLHIDENYARKNRVWTNCCFKLSYYPHYWRIKPIINKRSGHCEFRLEEY